jgi:hypothetical protein
MDYPLKHTKTLNRNFWAGLTRVALPLFLLMTSAFISLGAEGFPQANDSISAFWLKFSAAVIKSDKPAVAALTRFPVSMPYGVAAVKNRTQLISRYRIVFHGESDAAKCFKSAKPQTDPANAKLFTVGCKNAAGDEVVIYSFEKTTGGWKFTGLDNLNE